MQTRAARAARKAAKRADRATTKVQFEREPDDATTEAKLRALHDLVARLERGTLVDAACRLGRSPFRQYDILADLAEYMLQRRDAIDGEVVDMLKRRRDAVETEHHNLLEDMDDLISRAEELCVHGPE